MRALLISGLACLVVAGCSSRVFVDAPIVWRVEDNRSIPEPNEHVYVRYTHYADALVMDPLSQTLSVADRERARDINALDEVPDSTWFENRIGRYELTVDDVVRGPGGRPPRLPLTITKGKVDGSNPGFIVKDADKRSFLIKFDPVGHAEMQTSNAVIASRLFWAAGYNVPYETVTTFTRNDLLIDSKATFDEGVNEDIPFTELQIERLLQLAAPPKAGRYRVTASELLKGKPKGGYSDRGTRPDDPNDTIPHEHRRTLRGLQVFCAWLDHTDINPQNSLDMYVEEGGRKFLRHYLIDFGETLGAHGMAHPWMSYSHFFDSEHVLASAFSFGLWKRPWEDEPPQPFPSVGLYFSGRDPTAWREAKPYYAFRERTRADTFWAAKIIMRFQRDQIEALVAKAEMSDEAAARYLADTLMARRREVGLAYLGNVTALDAFSLDRGRLCAVDLAVRHNLSRRGIVERLVDGDVVERAPVATDGRVCFEGPGRSPYAVYSLRTVREDESLPAVEVHLRGGDNPRVQGVVRDF